MVSEEIRAMIPDYVRGLLSPTEAKELEAALADFPEITHDFEAARSYYAALNQIPEVRAPADFLDRVNHGLDHKPFLPEVFRVLFEPFHIKLPIEFAAVTACLIIAITFKNPFMPKEQLYATSTLSAPRAQAPVKSMTAGPAQEKKDSQDAVLAMAEAAPAGRKRAEPPADAEEINKRPAVAGHAVPAPTKKEQPAEPLASAPSAPRSASAAVAQKPAAEPALAIAKPAPAPARAPSGAATSAEAYAAALPTLAAAKTKSPKVAEMAAHEAAPIAMAKEARPAATVSAESEPAEEIENIGTIELSYVAAANEEQKKMEDVNAGSSATARPNPTATAATILNTYDPHFTKTIKNGKVVFICTFPPSRLNALIDELGKPFNVTTQLFPYDAQTMKAVKVTFVVR